jgi:hypothetical protein
VEYAPSDFKSDFEFILGAVKIKGIVLEYASQNLKSN